MSLHWTRHPPGKYPCDALIFQTVLYPLNFPSQLPQLSPCGAHPLVKPPLWQICRWVQHVTYVTFRWHFDRTTGASSHVEGQYRLDCSCSLRKVCPVLATTLANLIGARQQFFFDHHTMQSLTRSHKRRDGTRCDLDQDLINLVPVVRGRPC